MLRESNQAEAPGRDHGEGWSLAVSCILQASAFVLLSAPWWAKICWRSVRTIRLPRCDSGEINHMTVKMYISFLTMCQNLFWALTVVSFLFVTPCWGTRPFNIFKREDPGNVHSGFLVTLTDDADHQMAIICMMTAATSLLSFLFVMRFQHASEMCRAPQAQGCTRALWLKDLPIQDHATCQKHELTLSEFSSIVESDLREAIESHLDKKPDHQDSHNASFARRFLGSCGCCGCYLSCDFLCLCCHYESLWRRQQNDPHPLLGSRNSRRPVRRSSSHFHSWSNPTDSVQASSPRSSHVKEITVLPVMSEYCSYVNKYKKVKEAEERTRAWQKRAEAWQKKSGGVAKKCGCAHVAGREHQVEAVQPIKLVGISLLPVICLLTWPLGAHGRKVEKQISRACEKNRGGEYPLGDEWSCICRFQQGEERPRHAAKDTPQV